MAATTDFIAHAQRALLACSACADASALPRARNAATEFQLAYCQSPFFAPVDWLIMVIESFWKESLFPIPAGFFIAFSPAAVILMNYTSRGFCCVSCLAKLWELNAKNVHYPRSLGFRGWHPVICRMIIFFWEIVVLDFSICPKYWLKH